MAPAAITTTRLHQGRKRRSCTLSPFYSCTLLLSFTTTWASASLWNLPSDDVLSPSKPNRPSPTRLRVVLNEAGFLDDDAAALPQSSNIYDDILPDNSYTDIMDPSTLRPDGKSDKQSNTVPTFSNVPLMLHLDEPSESNVDWCARKNTNSQLSNFPSQNYQQGLTSPASSSFMSKDVSSRFRSTGTTIAGCVVASGTVVILGADTRATNDRMVADKYCFKIHTLGRNVACCGAGTAGDLDAMTRQCQYNLALQCLQEDSIGNDSGSNYQEATTHSVNPIMKQEESSGIWMRPVPFTRVCRMLRDSLYEAGGGLGVNLIVGGVDSIPNSSSGGRGHLVAIHPHGSMDVVPYAALGSGGLAAMAVLEQRYRPDMTVEEGTILIQQAITAGIRNDMGSGSQVDLCVIHANDGASVNITRAIVPEETLEEYNSGEPDHAEEQVDLSSSSSGVNGFGNLPYQVLSRRVVASLDDKEQQQRKWSDLLGL